MEYITPDAMRELERGAFGSLGVSVKDLMENAGRGVAEFVLRRIRRGQANLRRLRDITEGTGSAARYLSARCEVDVILLTAPEDDKEQTRRATTGRRSGTSAELHVAEGTTTLRDSGTITEADLIVVAIFGRRVREGVVKEPYSTARSTGSTLKAVEVDLPSGIDPETGAASSPTVRADVTVALHLPKVGLKGREEFTGEVVVVPIGMRGRTE